MGINALMPGVGMGMMPYYPSFFVLVVSTHKASLILCSMQEVTEEI